MRKMHLYAGLGALAAVLACGSAYGQAFNVSCVKGDDERTVSVVAPGNVGAMCDVRYVRDSGANVTTPYHADNSADFCQTKAQELVGTLISSGYACGEVGGALTAEARPAPAPAAPAPAAAVQPSAEPVADPTSAPAPVEPAAEAPVLPEPAEDLDNVTQTPDETAVPDTAAIEVEASPEAVEQEIANPELATGVATQGPAPLAGDRLEDLQKAVTPIPAGRLVGAAPEAAPVAEAAAEPEIETAAPSQVVSPASVKTEKSPTTPTAKAPLGKAPAGLRKPEEVVRATLNAQAAAWNEGNLPVFMETYWKDDDLTFVSGTAVTKGWSTTLKRYRERYAGDDGLGQLSFEKTDVEMVTDDVAIVTGRFSLLKGETQSSGVFSLVMKRIGGVWRIVHDHTTADEPAAE